MKSRLFSVCSWLSVLLAGLWFGEDLVYAEPPTIHLTFLEPFVIGATCAWCLTSAVVMTLLLWTTTAPVVQTWFANGINGSLLGGGR